MSIGRCSANRPGLSSISLVIISSEVRSFANPTLGNWLTTVDGYLAASLGVIYNPMRMAGK